MWSRGTGKQVPMGLSLPRELLKSSKLSQIIWVIENKKFKAATVSTLVLTVAPNLLDQTFVVRGTGQVLGTKITFS